MRSVHFLGNRKLEVVDIPDPTPDAGEVRPARRRGACVEMGRTRSNRGLTT